MQDDLHFEKRLTAHFAASDPQADAATERVLRALATQPLPPQKRPFALHWPSVLLNFDFTPSWPRVAAFSACVALGFVVGLTGIDTRIDEAMAGRSMASADISVLGSDAEPITGLRP